MPKISQLVNVGAKNQTPVCLILKAKLYYIPKYKDEGSMEVRPADGRRMHAPSFKLLSEDINVKL